jgi:urease accessory protein
MKLEAPHTSWRAELDLEFARSANKSVLAKRGSDGPLVVQKPLYPEGEEVCHAIIVHPPGGIAGGDELSLRVKSEAHTLLTTPGAAKWYRSAGPWARQKLQFQIDGTLEWLPRETIVFDGALAELKCEIRLGDAARYIGWEIVCLGRTGSGESFARGRINIDTRIYRAGSLLWLERGTIDAGGRLMQSPVGLDGKTVFGSLVATCDSPAVLNECRQIAPTTALAGLLIARYLGDSTEEAFWRFAALWKVLRPAVLGRAAIEPRIWST